MRFGIKIVTAVVRVKMNLNLIVITLVTACLPTFFVNADIMGGVSIEISYTNYYTFFIIYTSNIDNVPLFRFRRTITGFNHRYQSKKVKILIFLFFFNDHDCFILFDVFTLKTTKTTAITISFFLFENLAKFYIFYVGFLYINSKR